MAGFPVTLRVDGTAINKCAVALPLTITHGRSTINQQPDSPTCEFTWLGSDLPAGMEPGAEVTVTASTSGLRFKGHITLLKAIEEGGVVASYEVTAVGDQANLGRINVLLSRPEETDAERVTAIATAAGVPINIVGTASVTLSADSIDRDALSALHEVCESSGGLLWQDRTGAMNYGTPGHRDGSATEVLPCSAILDGVEWSNDTDLIVNHVTAKWREPAYAPAASTALFEGSPDDFTVHLTLGVDTVPESWVEVPFTDANQVLSHCATCLPTYRLGRTSTTLASQIKISTGTWVPVTTEAGANVTIADLQSWVSATGRVQVRLVGAVVQMRSGGVGGVELADHQETQSDPLSIAEWGERHVDVSTMCASVNDARLLALLVLARRKQPRWRMPGVFALPDSATPAEWEAALRMDVSTIAVVPVEAGPTPTPGEASEWYVEGWVHEYGTDGERLQIALSARNASETSGLTTWQAMKDGGDWAHWAGGSWLDQLT